MFEALRATAPEDVSYMVIELGDGSFLHLKTDLTDVAFEMSDLPAFRAFRDSIAERYEEPPRSSEAKIVGRYRG